MSGVQPSTRCARRSTATTTPGTRTTSTRSSRCTRPTWCSRTTPPASAPRVRRCASTSPASSPPGPTSPSRPGGSTCATTSSCRSGRRRATHDQRAAARRSRRAAPAGGGRVGGDGRDPLRGRPDQAQGRLLGLDRRSCARSACSERRFDCLGGRTCERDAPRSTRSVRMRVRRPPRLGPAVHSGLAGRAILRAPQRPYGAGMIADDLRLPADRRADCDLQTVGAGRMDSGRSHELLSLRLARSAASSTPSDPRRRAGARTGRPRLAPERPGEVARAVGQRAEPRPDVSEAGAQLGVAHLDGAHRVLQVGEDRVGLSRAPRPHARPAPGWGARAWAPRPARTRGRAARGARRSPAVRALRPPVGGLDRAEQRRLEPVGAVLVELLVGDAEVGERGRETLDRLRDVVEQLLPRLSWAPICP